MTNQPKVILRLGSHSEKEYFEKLAKSLDGMIFGGNLLEITPAATSSLIFALRTKRGGIALPFYIDPMTYCFGEYFDQSLGKRRTDLNALKSERTESRKSKKTIVAVKDSYMTLAGKLGPDFASAANDGKSCAAIEISKADSQSRDRMCKGVVEYQLGRIREILSDDEFLSATLGSDGVPAAVFAPYFFIHDTWARPGFEAALDLASRTVSLSPPVPVHVTICASHTLLANEKFVEALISRLPKTGVKGVWLWFDGFDEHKASLELLQAFRRIVQGLRTSMEIFNAHGGYYSLLLSHDGLTGISHGVGYGEKKSVVQVQGAAAPTVRYYLPPIRFRVGVPDVQRCFSEVGVATAEDFYSKVCDCLICKGVIGEQLANFAAFGDMHRATYLSKKDTQTPAAAKMCRYHFLINRFRERAVVAKLKSDNRSEHVESAAASWRPCPSLRQYLGEGDGYLELWANSLRE